VKDPQKGDAAPDAENTWKHRENIEERMAGTTGLEPDKKRVNE